MDGLLSNLRRIPGVILATAALMLGAPAGAAAADCAGADLRPEAATLDAVAGATLCLLNEERRARGLGRLSQDSRLERAGRRHAQDMVARQYFSHASRDGAHSTERIRATGYLGAAGRWTVGENLAWGTGEIATPRLIVAAWMDSPGHRANILQRRYREVGIGLALGNPRTTDGAGATYATEFGGVTAAAARRARGARR